VNNAMICRPSGAITNFQLYLRHPLAATLLKRGLIDFALQNSRVKRYRHAARHLRECKNLAARVDDFAQFDTHEAYLDGLKQSHGKKTSFWGAVA
ncbi:DUF6880 family protein, partial [Meridianimarinicoccus aquatilis]|uniref:DUF6880 family protein n=1 Tax=Meridianimarinicoccus aquatilis TaxID=2552766 RepID=UPI0031333186